MKHDMFMKKRTILTLIISILSLLGASTLVYSAVSPNPENYGAQPDGSVLSSLSETLASDTLSPDTTTLLTTLSETANQTTLPPVSTAPSASAAPNTTARAKAAPAPTQAPQTTPPTAPAVTTTPAAAPPQRTGNAPDFTVYDVNGNPVTLSSFAGKPVVINFWASWCRPCKEEMPHFQTMYNRYAGQGVVFLMVNLTDGSRETKSSALSYLNTNGFTFPAYFDTSRSASTAYGISSIPSTFFISKAGDIASRQIGQISPAALESGIKSIQ